MSPELKLKYTILDLTHIWEFDLPIRKDLTAEQVEELWDDAVDMYDAINETRTSGTLTGLPSESCRHYENDSVAVQCPNGDWVGFTYWYGGGKHGDPGSIDWIEHAYDIKCVEEQKMVKVRTFSKDE